MKKAIQTLFVFSFLAVSTASAQYNKLMDFASATTGSNPYGSLVSDGTSLYGMNSLGGNSNQGLIFKINPDGTGYTNLFDFDGTTTGNSPNGSLIYDGTTLYGMATSGGANGFGTIFKINPDGTGFVKLLDFDGANNGSSPFGSLISDGATLYGMTHIGGANNYGTIFKIDTDGTGYVKLLDFDGINGEVPLGSLIFDGTALYGMTRYGGTSTFGVMFKINTDGTGYNQLYNFNGGTNGAVPHGSLISDGTILYGMTCYGGGNNDGIIFKISNDGTNFTKLLDFDGVNNGSYPMGSLVSDGTTMYGMTSEGGTNNLGTIFNINPDGTGYTRLLEFDGVNNGSDPRGSLIFEGNVLYGMTFEGGSTDEGTMFKYCVPATTADVLSNVSACDTFNLPNLTVGDYYTGPEGTGTMLNAGNEITSTQTLYVYVTNGSCSNQSSFDVTIFPTPINTVTINANTLQSDEIGATFQWLDCDNGNAPIAGAISQSFTPTANGSYAVVITKNGCTSTSLCSAITTVNINEHQVNNINIYPNPTKGSFTIETESIGKTYGITNILGELVFQSTIKQKQTDIDLSNYPNGLYLLNIESETIKLIKH